jgi:hypothetical protein
MTSIKVFLETGKKKTFAGAIDWPVGAAADGPTIFCSPIHLA